MNMFMTCVGEKEGIHHYITLKITESINSTGRKKLTTH